MGEKRFMVATLHTVFGIMAAVVDCEAAIALRCEVGAVFRDRPVPSLLAMPFRGTDRRKRSPKKLTVSPHQTASFLASPGQELVLFKD